MSCRELLVGQDFVLLMSYQYPIYRFNFKMPKDRAKQFEKIYDDYIDKIYRFVFLKMDSEESAQDVTAQVFTKGWKKFKSGTHIKNVSAYLYQIARSEVSNYYRGSRKYQIVSVESVQILDMKGTTSAVEGKHQISSDIATVKKVLRQLDENSQNVLIWRYLDGYSNKEIAIMLGKSEGAVRVMIHRALAQMKEKMAGEWPESLFGTESS